MILFAGVRARELLLLFCFFFLSFWQFSYASADPVITQLGVKPQDSEAISLVEWVQTITGPGGGKEGGAPVEQLCRCLLACVVVGYAEAKAVESFKGLLDEADKRASSGEHHAALELLDQKMTGMPDTASAEFGSYPPELRRRYMHIYFLCSIHVKDEQPTAEEKYRFCMKGINTGYYYMTHYEKDIVEAGGDGLNLMFEYCDLFYVIPMKLLSPERTEEVLAKNSDAMNLYLDCYRALDPKKVSSVQKHHIQNMLSCRCTLFCESTELDQRVAPYEELAEEHASLFFAAVFKRWQEALAPYNASEVYDHWLKLRKALEDRINSSPTPSKEYVLLDQLARVKKEVKKAELARK
jgi:hypothetical protein